MTENTDHEKRIKNLEVKDGILSEWQKNANDKFDHLIKSVDSLTTNIHALTLAFAGNKQTVDTVAELKKDVEKNTDFRKQAGFQLSLIVWLAGMIAALIAESIYRYLIK